MSAEREDLILSLSVRARKTLGRIGALVWRPGPGRGVTWEVDWSVVADPARWLTGPRHPAFAREPADVALGRLPGCGYVTQRELSEALWRVVWGRM